MKHSFVILFIVLLIILNTMSVSAAATGECRISGNTLTLQADEIENGKEFTLTADIYVDSDTFDLLYACNISLALDTSAIDIAGSVQDCVYFGKGYHASAVEMPFGYNVILSNLSKKEAVNDFCTTLTVKLEIIDAEAVRAANGAVVTLTAFKNDFNPMKENEVICYEDVISGISKIQMTLVTTPMILAIEGKTTPVIPDQTSYIPPVTEPPVTEPPVTEPPVTEPPVTEPYWIDTEEDDWTDTEPSDTEPSDTEPSDTEPSDTEPSDTEPSDTKSSVANPVETKKPAEDTTVPVVVTPITTVPDSEATSSVTPQIYTVQLVYNNGTKSKEVSVVSGESLTLTTPEYKAHTFVGWFTDKELTNRISTEDFVPTSDTVLYAAWSLNQEIPQTGGESPVTVLCIVCAVVAVVIVAVVVIRKRKISQ